MSGVMCAKGGSARMKGKMYKVVVRPVMLYGLETVAPRKRQEAWTGTGMSTSEGEHMFDVL